MQPHVLKAVFSSRYKPLEELLYEFKPKELNKVNTEDIYLERVKEGFRQVMSPGGTGYWYVDPDYSPAGKTGTAQSFLDTDLDGMIDTATTTANFAGYAPYYEPRVVFAVFSPDVAPEYVPYGYMTNVNARISQKVSQKYFEIYH
jgi:cell division protein FtsI/penicillin-binding protein 2